MAASQRVLPTRSTCDSAWSSFLYGVDQWQVAMVNLYLHFAHIHLLIYLLPALLTIDTYPPFKYCLSTS